MTTYWKIWCNVQFILNTCSWLTAAKLKGWMLKSEHCLKGPHQILLTFTVYAQIIFHYICRACFVGFVLPALVFLCEWLSDIIHLWVLIHRPSFIYISLVVFVREWLFGFPLLLYVLATSVFFPFLYLCPIFKFTKTAHESWLLCCLVLIWYCFPTNTVVKKNNCSPVFQTVVRQLVPLSR